jgi:hypothetical protein
MQNEMMNEAPPETRGRLREQRPRKLRVRLHGILTIISSAGVSLMDRERRREAVR